MRLATLRLELIDILKHWDMKVYAYRMPESYELASNLPSLKLTTVSTQATKFASDSLQSTLQKFQVQMYLSVEQEDIEAMIDELVEKLEMKNIFYSFSMEMLHENIENILVVTLHFTYQSYKKIKIEKDDL